METETKTLELTLDLERGLALDPQLNPPQARGLPPAPPPGQWVKYARDERERGAGAERQREIRQRDRRAQGDKRETDTKRDGSGEE